MGLKKHHYKRLPSDKKINDTIASIMLCIIAVYMYVLFNLRYNSRVHKV